MTLNDAVKELNKWRHNGINNWRIEDGFVVGDFREYRSVFEPFDAIAIAEKLKRDTKPETMTATDWFGCLVEANEIGDANAASFASAELRALGWEIKAVDGTWGDQRSMPATRHVLAMLADLRGDDWDSDDDLVGFARSEAVAEALNEWSTNPSTETDA